MTRKNLLTVMFGLALILTLMFAGCELEGEAEKIVDTVEPAITEMTPSTTKAPGSWVDIVVEAESSDGGDLTFQWYELAAEYESLEGTAIPGKTSSTLDYELPATEGIIHFYVVITNTNPKANGIKSVSIRSAPVTVYVLDLTSPIRYPVIKQHPADATAMAGAVTLTVEAEIDAAQTGGTLSYQWYRSETASNKSGTAIEGAVDATLVELLAEQGTFYFYVVVTSNLDDATKSVTSHPATIEVVEVGEPNATLVLNSSRKYQYVRGFGGMDIPWSSFFSITEEEYEKMFNPDTGLGLNMLRIMIMPENPTDNTDPEKTIDYYLADGGRPNYIKGAQIVNKHGGYLLASPWSPPPEWKTNNDIRGGGSLRTSNYNQYAAYLKRYAEVMAERGAPIYAVSIQNEPNFMASYDGCEWSPQEMRDFLKQVGRFTEGVAGYGGGKALDRVLIMNGESANHPNINDAALDDPVSRDLIDLIGRHTYGNVQTRYEKAINLGKEVWMTEHNINSGNEVAYPNDYTWNYIWMFMNDIDVSIRLNDESAFIWWAIKRFYSVVGDGQYGSVEGVILPRGYALSHYAKFAKEMWRIAIAAESSSTTADGKSLTTSNFNNTGFDRNSTAAKATAFISEDGNTISVVLWTPTNTSGGNGVDMGTVKIKLPSSFTASSATAMRSTASVKAKTETVLLSDDKNSAIVMLPPGNVLSVRFTK